MFDFLSFIYNFVMNMLFDVVIYILVDVVAKNSLHNTRDEEEKRLIWFYEALLLLLLVMLTFLFHHIPYLLTAMTLATFLYTQLHGKVNFRYWWRQLVTRWDEFEQHEESMENLAQGLQQQQRQVAPPPPPALPVTNQPTATVGWMPPPPVNFMQPSMTFEPGKNDAVDDCEAWFASSGEKGPTTTAAASSHQSTHAPPCTVTNSMQPNLRYRGQNTEIQQPVMTPTHTVPQQPQTIQPSRYTPVMPRSSELVRRPLRTYAGSPTNKTNPTNQNSQAKSFTSRVKSSVMTALGWEAHRSALPGLKNQGQNLCFINSVLQCLSHSPAVAESLSYDCRRLHDFKRDLPLLRQLSEVLEKLAVSTNQEGYEAQDTKELRQVMSKQKGGTVISPEAGLLQTQQDAAEFLMWILDSLHTILNVPFVRMPHATQVPNAVIVERHPSCPRFTSMTLNMLKFIYGDLTPTRVSELKASCRKEIERANGLDNESYAEPIQRLSDLEWLTYKEQNNSALDDLFTGQLVEAQHCISCNRISVGMQTFNVLPVPVVEPRSLNGIVYLEDCFAKFGNIEALYGADGLRCDTCNGPQSPWRGSPTSSYPPRQQQQLSAVTASPILRNGGPSHPTGDTVRRNLPSDSAMGSTFGPSLAMSPISSTQGEVVNDSGYHDNQFRTSTPIHGTTAPFTGKMTDGQRRSLLRQLPECLVVQLMRFTYNHGSSQKVVKPVSVPLVNLDLNHLVIDNVMKREDLTALNACYRYDLYGLCLHLGSQATSCGHYVAYTQTGDGHWYLFDDEVVKQVNMTYELNTRKVRENAYLLFYRKSVLV